MKTKITTCHNLTELLIDEFLSEEIYKIKHVRKSVVRNSEQVIEASFCLNDFGNDSLFENLIGVQSEQVIVPSIGVNKKLAAASFIIALGTGFASMPIFNKEIKNLENFNININIHEYESTFIISTLNTLLAITSHNNFSSYKFFNEYKEPSQESNKTVITAIGKIGAAISSAIPIALLWNIELKDQAYDGSYGFDKYVMWAAFTTLPLLATKSIKSYESFSKILTTNNEHHLTSIGDKIFTYGITAISVLARSLAFTHITTEFAKNIGFEDDAADVIGISLGGVIASAIVGLSEYSSLKKLFKPNMEGLTKKDILIGSFSAVEGAWFSLPFISAGLKYVESWNPLLKGAIFAPFFISHTISEGTVINDSFQYAFSSNDIEVIGNSNNDVDSIE